MRHSGQLLQYFLFILPELPFAAAILTGLVRVPRRQGRSLWAVTGVGLGAAALLLGGGAVLARLGLAWRVVPVTALFAAAWLSLAAAGFLAVWLLGRHTESRLALPLLVLMALALLPMLWEGMFIHAFGPGGHTETVGLYQGRTVVQCRESWLGVTYTLYEYRGPLFRGAEALAVQGDQRFF